MGNPHDRTVTIKAFRDHSQADGVRFEMYDDRYDADNPTLILKFSKDDDKMKKVDFHRVRFVLVNNDGLSLKFAADRNDALWVVDGPGPDMPPCPRKRPNKGKTALEAQRVHDHELVAHNSNNEKSVFSFSLNFVAATDVTGSKLIPFDPGGINHNGGEASE